MTTSELDPEAPAACSSPRVIRTCACLMMVASLVAITSCKTRPAPLREVTLGLSWRHQAQFSGPYYADQRGLYASEGLRVNLVPGGVAKDPLDELIAGNYDFVIAQPEPLIAARQAGHRVKAIAVTYRVHPQAFIALESSGITRPQDFRGKTIAIGYSERLPLIELLKKLGIEPDEVNTVQRGYDYEDLRTGKVDVQTAWIISELPAARQAGMKLNVISPYDYGVTFYADVLATRESLIEQEPELVEDFVRATMRGWALALQDPEESAKLPLHYDPELDPARELQILKASAPLIHTGVDQLGWMRGQDWEAMIRALHEQGITAERIEPGDVYTTRFLEAIQQR